jgi:hypothetical protein
MCTAPRIEDLDLEGVDTVAVDLETYDPNLKNLDQGPSGEMVCLRYCHSNR